MTDAKKTLDHDSLAFDDEYSRLMGTIGKEALVRLQQSKIFITGVGGLGIEIAKNIVLMGVKNVTIHDTENVSTRDLSSQFFLRKEHIGQNRAKASLGPLRELNDRCALSLYEGEISTGKLDDFQIVVLTNMNSKKKVIELTDYCHSKGIYVITAESLGLFSYVFVDFSKTFHVEDLNGSPPRQAYIVSITGEKEGCVVTKKKHDLSDGQLVTFSEIEGMSELNGTSHRIKVQSPVTFTIGDTSTFGLYKAGGMVTEVKEGKTFHFDSFRSQISQKLDIWSRYPNVICFDGNQTYDGRADQYHLFLQALLDFRASNKGALPAPYNVKDAEAIIAIGKKLREARILMSCDEVPEVDEGLWKKLSFTAAGDLSPVDAVIGGIVAQEIIKAAGRKYTPLQQWFFFEMLSALPKTLPTAEECAPLDSRYDGQIAVFGRKIQKIIQNQKWFLVGAGAIGCEILKNWGMMGIGTGPEGLIHLTDLDTIEISNLNRQFLYRPWDVTRAKSTVAGEAITKMNPDIKIKSVVVKAAPETEDVFDSKFWNSLDGCCAALDNVKARQYLDDQIVFYRKPLLESGTLGTKGHSQIIIPFKTKTYNDVEDPPNKNVAKCLLHGFPSNIDMCLQWSRELLFEGNFVIAPEMVNNYVTQPDYISTIPANLKRKNLSILRDTLVNRPKNFSDCIKFARELFDKTYNHHPQLLLTTHPLDEVDRDGIKFWTGGRRPPAVITYDEKDQFHVGFVTSCALIWAWVHNINKTEFKPTKKGSTAEAKALYEKQLAQVKAEASKIPLKPYVHDPHAKVAASEEEEKALESASDVNEKEIEALIKELPSRDSIKDMKLNVLDFEKDDDANYHIDFIHYSAQIRAKAYKIPQVNRLKSKLVAGKIIPAIVTTTAVVSGLVCIEMYKWASNAERDLGTYTHSFCDIGYGIYTSTSAAELAAPKLSFNGGKEFTKWDWIEMKPGAGVTLGKFIDDVEAEHGIDIAALNIKVGSSFKLLYPDPEEPGNFKKNRDKNLRDLVSSLFKTPIKKGKSVSLLIVGEPEEEKEDLPEDAEHDFPPVHLYLD